MAEETGQQGQGGGQTDAGATGQQPNTSQQQQPANNQGTGQQSQQTSQQQSGQAALPTAFSYKEDRSDWIPRHRFNESSTKARDLETRLQERDRQIAALTGAQQPDANAAKANQVKEAFFNLPGMGAFRKLASLTDEQLDKLLSTPNHVEAVRQAESKQWQRHGNAQVDVVAQKVADAIGAENLDADQKSDLRESFSAWIKQRAKTELQQSAERYGDDKAVSDTIRRYEDGDPKLLDEFVTRYTKNWVEPARRSATARTFNRTRPVPDSSGRSQVTSIQRPDKFKSLDERLDYAVGLAKERGVSFGK